MVTVEVSDAPARMEYIAWNSFSRAPAAAALLAVLGIPDPPDAGA